MGDAPGINLAVYGIVLVLMVSFLPRGVVGLLHARRTARASANA
jgi:ABC-type branched-subunit amino acid transport system permease subunit